MLTPEQTVRFELVKAVISTGTPVGKIIDEINRLSEWILSGSQTLPCSTADKA